MPQPRRSAWMSLHLLMNNSGPVVARSNYDSDSWSKSLSSYTTGPFAQDCFIWNGCKGMSSFVVSSWSLPDPAPGIGWMTRWHRGGPESQDPVSLPEASTDAPAHSTAIATGSTTSDSCNTQARGQAAEEVLSCMLSFAFTTVLATARPGCLFVCLF